MMPLLAAWAAARAAAPTTGWATAALPAVSAARACFRLLRSAPNNNRLRPVRLMRCRARLAADTWFAIIFCLSSCSIAQARWAWAAYGSGPRLCELRSSLGRGSLCARCSVDVGSWIQRERGRALSFGPALALYALLLIAIMPAAFGLCSFGNHYDCLSLGAERRDYAE